MTRFTFALAAGLVALPAAARGIDPKAATPPAARRRRTGSGSSGPRCPAGTTRTITSASGSSPHLNPDAAVVFKCNMDAGHGGASGRYDARKEQALVTAFVLDQMGITK